MSSEAAGPAARAADRPARPVFLVRTRLAEPGSDRLVPVVVHAPADGCEPLPVIVLSHGGAASPDTYQALGAAWAAEGYVVVLPRHDDSLTVLRRRVGGRERLLPAIGALMADPDSWRRRVGDLALVVDQLGAVEAAAPALAGRLDRARLGIAGHSLGAFTAALAAGARPAVEREPFLAVPEARAVAFVFLSPAGAGGHLRIADWSQAARPALWLTGTLDHPFPGRVGPDVEQRLAGFRAAPARPRYAAVIDGGAHLSFLGPAAGTSTDPVTRSLPYPPPDPAVQAAVFETATVLSTAFWDAVLRDDPVAQRWLASGAASGLPRGAAVQARP